MSTAITPRTPVAYAYVRVSTVSQAKEGYSIDDQMRQTKGFYDNTLAGKGVIWGDFYQDPAISGTIDFDRRPAGGELFKRLQPGDHVIVAKFDRAFRTFLNGVAVTEEWLKKGINVHVLDIGATSQTPTGMAIFRILAVFASMNRDLLMQNLNMGKEKMRKERGWVAAKHAPLGWKFIGRAKNRRMIPDHRDRSIIVLWARLRRQGWPIQRIVRLAEIDPTFKRTSGYKWSFAAIYNGLQALKKEKWDDKPFPVSPKLISMKPDRITHEFIAMLRNEEQKRLQKGEPLPAGLQGLEDEDVFTNMVFDVSPDAIVEEEDEPDVDDPSGSRETA